MQIEEQVASVAQELAESEEQAKGDGRCWALIHHVLDRARAMSFWEFNDSTTPASSMSPWGKKAESPKRGYVVVLKGTKWEVHTAHKDPFGKVTKSNVISLPTLEGAGHIGIVLRVSPKHIEIAQQNCTMTWKGIKPQQIASLLVPITKDVHYEAAEHGKYFLYKLKDVGQVAYFRPLAMKDGKRPSSPTPKSQQAIKP